MHRNNQKELKKLHSIMHIASRGQGGGGGDLQKTEFNNLSNHLIGDHT